MRYVKRTLSENFKDHRPAMVPGIPSAIEAAEARAKLAQIRDDRLWDTVGGDDE